MDSINTKEFLLEKTQSLLDSIDLNNFKLYESLTAEDLTAFEPEGNGCLISGIGFHEFFFKNKKDTYLVKSTISNPNVKLLADYTVGIVSYNRIQQIYNKTNDTFNCKTFQETRVWNYDAVTKKWIHVHFHRS